MSNHYAVELTLLLYHEGEWVRRFTYYNHGKEPPFGGVRSGESVDPVVMAVWEFENSVKAVGSWIGHVVSVCKSIKPVPSDGTPDMPVEYSVDPMGDILVYTLEMESMKVTITYDIDEKTVTFASKDAFDISWRGFLFHHETVQDFLEQVKGA